MNEVKPEYTTTGHSTIVWGKELFSTLTIGGSLRICQNPQNTTLKRKNFYSKEIITKYMKGGKKGCSENMT